MDSEDLPLRRPPRLFTEMETAKATTSSTVLWIWKTYRSMMHRKTCTPFQEPILCSDSNPCSVNLWKFEFIFDSDSLIQDLCLRLSLLIRFLWAFVFMLLTSNPRFNKMVVAYHVKSHLQKYRTAIYKPESSEAFGLSEDLELAL